MTLFFLQGKISFDPGAPAPFKGEYVRVSVELEELCHPGTCSFVLSGTIKYQGLIPGIFFKPLVHPGWVFPNSCGDFLAAPPPVSVSAYIDDHRTRKAQAILDLMDGKSRYLGWFACERHGRLSDN